MRKIKLLAASMLLLLNIAGPMTAAFATDANLMANPSAETISGSSPANWTANDWGTNTASVTVSSDAHTGTNSLSTVVSSYTNGDAKWMPDAVSVAPNTTYTYSSWYKASVQTEVDLQYTDTSGQVSYVYLDSPAAASSWTNYSKSFTTPSNTAKVSVLQIVAKVGSLTTDDFSLTQYSTPVATGTNLIANPSFETSNGSTPAGWSQDAWGTNTPVFTYDSTGHTGTHSATVTMQSYTNGDAKWDAGASGITAGSSYAYSDFYESGVVTRVVAAFTMNDGTTTYVELPTAPAAASAWAQYTTTFTAPANANKVTIYHLIDKVGSLSIDDVDLEAASSTGGSTGGGTADPMSIANASLETANGSQPADWTQESWGNNTAAFSYENTGHIGSHSVKVTVSKYTDGDAKWMFTPITGPQSNKQYTFSAWYKGSVNPAVVAMYTLSDGSLYYANLPSITTLPSTTTWQHYAGTFSAPANTVSTTVFMLVNQNGWVQTDDYSITPYTPTGFSRPIVSLTFDDGWATNYTNVLPVLKQYGFKSTQYIISGFIGDSADGYMTAAQIKALQSAGSEIGSHTVTHPHLPLLTPTQLTTELSKSQSTLTTDFGTKPMDFASPYGEYNATVIAAIKKYYTSHRTVDAGYNSKDNLNLYQLKVQNIFNTTTPADVASWVKQAQADRTWLIIVYHAVDATPDTYDSSITNFKAEMANLKSSGVTVETMKSAISEVKAQ